jgi:predicted nucleotide-binding protein
VEGSLSEIKQFTDSQEKFVCNPNNRQTMDQLNEGLIHVDLQLNNQGELDTAAERMKLDIETENVPTVNVSIPMNSKKVFVVHGRNEQIRKDMFAWLRAIELEPIEWTQAVQMTGKAAPYVGEILDVALAYAQAIVVVMTPDDEARLRLPYLKENDPPHERELSPQPRANVLFEAGLALGRNPDRTLLVEIGWIRPFSDVSGQHAVRLDNSIEKRQDLANRLKNAGCDVQMNGTDWHREGDFEIHLVDDTLEEEPVAVVAVADVASGEVTEISETESDILQMMATAGSARLTVAEVAHGFGFSETRAEYFLELLEKQDYVIGAHFYTGQPSTYGLSSKGRTFLVESGLA